MILGILGKAGAGKDTFADILVRDHGFVKIALADEIKRICKRVFDFSDEQLFGPSVERNAPDTRYIRVQAKTETLTAKHTDGTEEIGTAYSGAEYLTPRFALQQLGTEWGRRCYENVWIDLALRTAKAVQSGRPYSQTGGLGKDPGFAMARPIVIPDVRFQNECDAIRAVGGRVMRITRPGTGGDPHVSETEQDSVTCDGTFANEGTINDMEKYILTWMRNGPEL